MKLNENEKAIIRRTLISRIEECKNMIAQCKSLSIDSSHWIEELEVAEKAFTKIAGYKYT